MIQILITKKEVKGGKTKMTSKLLQTLGMVGALAVAGLSPGCARKPLEYIGATFERCGVNKEDTEVYPIFKDENGTTIFLDNRDRNFKPSARYEGQKFDISGYSTAFGKYATKITPARVKSE
jgi:hypothetical protein